MPVHPRTFTDVDLEFSSGYTTTSEPLSMCWVSFDLLGGGTVIKKRGCPFAKAIFLNLFHLAIIWRY